MLQAATSRQPQCTSFHTSVNGVTGLVTCGTGPKGISYRGVLATVLVNSYRKNHRRTLTNCRSSLLFYSSQHYIGSSPLCSCLCGVAGGLELSGVERGGGGLFYRTAKKKPLDILSEPRRPWGRKKTWNPSASASKSEYLIICVRAVRALAVHSGCRVGIRGSRQAAYLRCWAVGG